MDDTAKVVAITGRGSGIGLAAALNMLGKAGRSD